MSNSVLGRMDLFALVWSTLFNLTHAEEQPSKKFRGFIFEFGEYIQSNLGNTLMFKYGWT